ncbi:hypothetical protein LHYA1_G006548 [Lachnellula hyalina]|uniref:Thioredoxin domain-containing protein n=1 Tax=Lachnellula hyalina TaxID=1316788 RepID=A0A8H8QZN6_9HELO|nr:uncharacterized protein LHYA1_G006548 [Lachnellula hyalina]TVY25713.1 hypothetical protein LHYA1_G006548 [Lachnellula hyalina]
MFSKLTAKIALRKAGIPSNALSFPESKPASKDPDAPAPFANPFANLSVPKSWQSWATPPPPPIELRAAPVIGSNAPSSAKLRLPVADGRPAVVVFLRHCGCPFAEKTFLEARRLANKYPRLNFIAVSHSSRKATDKWISSIGGAWAVTVVVDEEREVYASWGLGVSTTYHLLNPWTQVAMHKLGKEEGIWAREVDPSGNRWQVGGGWAMDEVGIVRWGAASKTADDMPNLVEACETLGAF